LQLAAEAGECVAVGIYAYDLEAAIGQSQRRIYMVGGAFCYRSVKIGLGRAVIFGPV
jgi:hypothetical protein